VHLLFPVAHNIKNYDQIMVSLEGSQTVLLIVPKMILIRPCRKIEMQITTEVNTLALKQDTMTSE